MTQKELKKLSRAQLLEMLIVQTEKAEQLEKELEDTKNLLADRKLQLEKVGSIAEAALDLNGVFKAAQEAADQYLENAIASYQDVDLLRSNTKMECDRMLLESQKKCDDMKIESMERCTRMEAESTERCKRMENESVERCKRMEADTIKRCRNAIRKMKAEMATRR